MIPTIHFKSKNVLDDIEQAYNTVGFQFLKKLLIRTGKNGIKLLVYSNETIF